MKKKKEKLVRSIVVFLWFLFLSPPVQADPTLEAVYPTLGKMNHDLEVTLTGKGFDEDTRVSMHLDSRNNRAIIGWVDTPCRAFGVTIVDDKVYVADNNDGLQVIDVGIPQDPQIIGSVDTPGSAEDVTVVGNRAYVADGSEGLQVIDVGNPGNPQILGSVDTPGRASDVTVVGNRAYVADGREGLQVIDISESENLQILGSVATPGRALGVTVDGERAYVADDREGLQVVDISESENLQIIGSVATPGSAEDVTVVGNRVYVADGSEGLQVIDISESENLQILGSVATPGSAEDVTVVGKRAYVADGSEGLQVIDVGNPESPQIIDSVATPGSATGVTVFGDKAYVASGNDLIIITSAPVLIDSITVNSETEISLTLPHPVMAGSYTLRVFNNFNKEGYDEIEGAVSFITNATVLDSKAIIVAGAGPDAPGNIWDVTMESADKAYNILIHEGFDHDDICYLTDDHGNESADRSPSYDSLKWALNTWAQDASELIIFFVGHGSRDDFIIHSDGDNSQTLSAYELDKWLDTLQQTMIGPVTFIYDACYSGTFAAKLSPLEEKDRIVITGASDEKAYFFERTEDDFDTFSIQFWDGISQGSGIGDAFNQAAKIMRKYHQTALINADGNSIPNEKGDYSIANKVIIGRAKPIFLKPSPTMDEVVGEITLDGDSTAEIWVRHVRDAENVQATIIPPHIEPEQDSGRITDRISITLSDSDHDGTYAGTYDGFTMQGSYLVVIQVWTSQEIYNYVQGVMTNQIIPSLPGYTAVTQINGTQGINADSYEEDDRHQQAKVIVIDDPGGQPHHFDDPGDADWVKFFALSREIYTISVENPSPICDAVIELYDGDGATLLGVSDNSGGAGNDTSLYWTCPQDGIYCVKISSANTHFGENVKYDLKIYRPIAPSLSVPVSGRVLGPDHEPLSDIRIFTDGKASALSDETGKFFIHNPEGRCTLTLESNQYGTTILQIDVIAGQENDHEIIYDSGLNQPTKSSSSGGGGCFIRASAM